MFILTTRKRTDEAKRNDFLSIYLFEFVDTFHSIFDVDIAYYIIYSFFTLNEAAS